MQARPASPENVTKWQMDLMDGLGGGAIEKLWRSWCLILAKCSHVDCVWIEFSFALQWQNISTEFCSTATMFRDLKTALWNETGIKIIIIILIWLVRKSLIHRTYNVANIEEQDLGMFTRLLRAKTGLHNRKLLVFSLQQLTSQRSSCWCVALPTAASQSTAAAVAAATRSRRSDSYSRSSAATLVKKQNKKKPAIYLI